jgi:hypothetical protein
MPIARESPRGRGQKTVQSQPFAHPHKTSETRGIGMHIVEDNSLRRSAASALFGCPSFEQVISALSSSRYPVSPHGTLIIREEQ